ncbi:MAG: histone [Thermoanaerobaculia bacterium]
MKKLATILMLSFFALTAGAAFAGDDKKCDAKADKKSGHKCCAAAEEKEKKVAKPADKNETAKPAAAVAKNGASAS